MVMMRDEQGSPVGRVVQAGYRDSQWPQFGWKPRGKSLERVFVGLGLIMLVGGLAAVGLGLPYIVLERGFTQVIVGTSVAASGLVLAALGIVLRNVRALRILVIGLRASAAVDASGVNLPSGSDATDDPGSSAHKNVTTTGLVAAGAGAAAGAAALAGGALLAAEAKAGASDSKPPIGASPEMSPDLAEGDMAAATALPGGETDELTAKIDHAVDDLSALRRDLMVEYAGEDDAGVRTMDIGANAAEDADISSDDAAKAVEGDPLHETDADQADPAEDTAVENPVAPAALGDESEDAHPPATESADEDTPEAEAQPVASEEGVVGIHTVGASTFTMYSDGTIRAQTPAGPLQFPDVAALKLYLAGENVG
jgi:hypothetical protein